MASIREVAVFAWALTGINGSLERYTRGTPSGESQPPGGFPIWDPNANAGPETIERPIGGAYLLDTHASSDQNHTKGRSGPRSNGSKSQIQNKGYQGHAYSNGSSPQIQSAGNAHHSHSSNAQIKGHSNGIHRAGHDALVQWRETDYNPQAISYHNNAEPNSSNIHYSQHERIWDPIRQLGQGSNTDGSLARFG